MSTRTQTIVAALSTSLKTRTIPSERAARLPSMLHRNGLLQTLAFADSRKEDDWRSLASVLRAGLRPFTDTDLGVDLETGESTGLQSLAGLPTARYLRLQGLAIEVAGWIYRLTKARELSAARGAPTGGNP